MEKRGLSQEGLKIIACVTMLIDHLGAIGLGGVSFRVVGRMAFPIYCFLLAEGVHHTRHPGRYGLRLAVGAVLSEIPFDLLFFGRITWLHQSVMVTLLLGFLFGMAVKKVSNDGSRVLLTVPFCLLGQVCMADYGGLGVAMIAVFILTRGGSRMVQAGTLALVCFLIGGGWVRIGPVMIPMEMFGLLALVPIYCYSGRKATRSGAVQGLFYLFYPAHLTALLLWR